MLAVSVFASSAFACPNLAGTFACPADQNNSASISYVSQSVQNGTTIYSIRTTDTNGNVLTAGEYIADGVARPFPEGPSGEMIPESYSCEADSAVRMNSNFSDPHVGQITMVEHFALDAQGNMHLTADVNFGPYPPQHEDKICTRQ